MTRYRCAGCGAWSSSVRRTARLSRTLWREYVRGKRTKDQLGTDVGKTPRTITKLLDAIRLPAKVHCPRPVVLVLDATYFGREYGVLVARDPNAHENLYVAELRHETKLEYAAARRTLEGLGYTIQAVVLDGRRGIPRVFDGIPVQICQYHQWQIVRRALTTRPKLDSHKALLAVGRLIAKSTEDEMRAMLERFAQEYRDALEEKHRCPCCGKPKHVHRKLRSAYRSLMTNLPFLYTYQRYPVLKIPNTTNSMDGAWNALKAHVNVHRGMRFDRRFKVIRAYLGL
ncbi:hypothetical protein FJY94_01330 [Candidatus Kaiserbacteria bacterium]|nr:hypothetical protein [Candidatus Kaiserbacteria bacterium]